jgi:hypothetical protein
MGFTGEFSPGLTIVVRRDGIVCPIIKRIPAMKLSKWRAELHESVCHACVNDVKGRMSGFSYRWAAPTDNHWGIWLLQIAPSVMEISGGKNDGEMGFDFVDVDLLALGDCLDEIESFDYDPDYGHQSHLTLIGKKAKRDVVVEIYLQPLEDDEPTTIFDVKAGAWREKP